jgi:ketosteroid isomerase-like protein
MADDATPMQPSPAWARADGRVELRPLRHDEESSRAVDRALIAERIYRYGWGYDERDRAYLADCFTDDAVWEGNVMGHQPVGPIKGREAVVDWLGEFWGQQQDQRRHIFTNVIVDELTPSSAVAHAYLLLTASAGATMTPVTAGPYRLVMRREADSWRIERLVAGFDAPF